MCLAACGSSETSSTTAARTAPGAGASLKVQTAPSYTPPAGSAPVQSGVVQVAYRDFSIAPDTLRVRVGTTVRWRNYDSAPHNVTSESGPQRFASPSLGEGASFQVKLTRPGVIHYESTTQPATMNGTIEVLR